METPTAIVEQAQVENIVAHIESDTVVTEATAAAVVAEAEARVAVAEAIVEQVETPAAAQTAERDDVLWLEERLNSQDLLIQNLSQQLAELLTNQQQNQVALMTELQRLITPQQTVVISSPPNQPNEPPTPSPQSASEGDPQEAQPSPNETAPKATKRRRI